MALNSVSQYLTNNINPVEQQSVCGIIGDTPSTSARSPIVWNAVFDQLNYDATFLPFDVANKDALERLVAYLRGQEEVKGVSVTVPYKQAIMPMLDQVDKKAQSIGAVNFIHRTESGQLIGYNTDGLGGVVSMLEKQPGQHEPLIETLEGKTVLIYGAGGAAKALALEIGERLGTDGRLGSINRNHDDATELARNVGEMYGIGTFSFVEETNPYHNGIRPDLIVNASVKGQGGLKQTEEGITCLEPYSALWSAKPTILTGEFHHRSWMDQSRADIEKNNQKSIEVIGNISPEAVFFDAIHTPKETTMLRQARFLGHRTINGIPMNVNQGVEAFKIAFPKEDHNKVRDIMYQVP